MCVPPPPLSSSESSPEGAEVFEISDPGVCVPIPPLAEISELAGLSSLWGIYTTKTPRVADSEALATSRRNFGAVCVIHETEGNVALGAELAALLSAPRGADRAVRGQRLNNLSVTFINILMRKFRAPWRLKILYPEFQIRWFLGGQKAYFCSKKAWI